MKIACRVLSVTPADVLYVPIYNEACLMSCRKIEMQGRYRMVGEDGIITVECKSDHIAIYITELMYGCFQVLPLARHNKIYTATSDFWHPALCY